jgi:UDP-N-acetylglucosamine 1-carboxyvinyltransferase
VKFKEISQRVALETQLFLFFLQQFFQMKNIFVKNVPCLHDMESTLKMLLHFGAHVNQHFEATWGSRWIVDTSRVTHGNAPYDLVRKMRASFFSLGPILGRLGKGRVSLPGGCAIGARPVDLHLMAFEKLGATIEQSGGDVDIKAPGGRLVGNKARFPRNICRSD